MKHIATAYRRRQQLHQEGWAISHKQGARISSLRVVAFVLFASCLAAGFQQGVRLWLFLAPLAFIAFLLLVNWHNRVKVQTDLLSALVRINEEAQMRLAGKWTSFTDAGEDFVDHEHPFTTDLHVFGQGSLFQQINTTFSFSGRRALARLLKQRTPLTEVILRQQAVADLAGRLDFRQRYEALGRLAQLKESDPAALLSRFARTPHRTTQWMLGKLWLFPLLPGLLLLGVMGQLLPPFLFSFSLTIQLLIAVWGARMVAPAFDAAEKAVRSLGHYPVLLRHLEEERFNAPSLIRLQKRLFSTGRSASRQLDALSRIAELISLRYNQPFIYHPINILFLWDWRTLARLERWKRSALVDLTGWFEVMGEFEALGSLAGLAHDNSEWTLPQFRQGPGPTLQAQGLGHPLIHGEKRVVNNATLGNESTIMIITGSNMSGKTTWLRTIGLNLVLAYSGAPVCAERFSCTEMDIYCKMHVQDDLQEQISTFWAELKRMKLILDAAQSRQPIIFLLDEIFRGTNSRDRILATRIVVKQLLQLRTIGLITTHDLELSTLQDEYPSSIANFHFADYVRDERIYFDHRLHNGVSQSANALALMKMIGIEVDTSSFDEKSTAPN